MTKKQVAKEWLYFLGCFCFGLLIFPSLLYLIFRLLSNKEGPQFFFQFYSVVAGGRDALLAWSFVLAPYLIFQLVRSVIWDGDLTQIIAGQVALERATAPQS